MIFSVGYLLVIFLVLALYFWIGRVGRNHRQTVLTIFGVNRQNTQVQTPVSTSQTDPLNPSDAARVGGAAIGLNNTGQQAVFVGTGTGQEDLLLVSVDGKLVNIIDQTNISSTQATHAAVSVDIDYNGYTDLVVARDNGVYLYKNYGRGHFKKRQLMSESQKTIPISLAVTDYNKDGHMDLYVSHHVHPLLAENRPTAKWSTNNTLLENIGAGIQFEDVTSSTASGGGLGQTKASTFVDLNNDRIPDLVLLQDTGELEIHQGTRGMSGDKFVSGFLFKKRRVPTGLGYVTNLKVADYNGDGLPDMLLNRRSSQSSRAKQEHVLLLNGGNFDFQTSSDSQQKDIDLGWSSLMEDQQLIQKQVSADQLDQVTGQRDKPIPIDLDGDGRADLLWINVQGPTMLTQGKNRSNDQYVNVKLPDRVPFLNATVSVVSINDQTGKKRVQQQQSLHGIDSGRILHFNLGDDTRILDLRVRTIYDNVYKHPFPRPNTTLTFRDAKH